MKIPSLQFFNSTRLIIGILIIVFAFLQYELWFSQGGIRTLLHLNHQVTAQQKTIEKINKSNSILTADIVDLQHGSDATEERARKHLGMIEKGETYYQFVS